MLTRAGTIALRALVELARSPQSVLSGPELAKRQELPEARLEQILLQLRHAKLIEAKRGIDGNDRSDGLPSWILVHRWTNCSVRGRLLQSIS